MNGEIRLTLRTSRGISGRRVTIRKDAGEHIETVHDTVRRTEVEIDDTTGTRTAGSAGVTGSETSNPPGTAASRAVDKALDTNISGTNPTHKP
jgi:hypothetical protein